MGPLRNCSKNRLKHPCWRSKVGQNGKIFFTRQEPSLPGDFHPEWQIGDGCPWGENRFAGSLQGWPSNSKEFRLHGRPPGQDPYLQRVAAAVAAPRPHEFHYIRYHRNHFIADNNAEGLDGDDGLNNLASNFCYECIPTRATAWRFIPGRKLQLLVS